MNGKRAYWKLLMASAGVGLLITNCTIKSATDAGTAGSGDGACTVGSRHAGCTCTGNVIGAQTCLADGTYGACVCATDTGGTGGTSSVGGTSSTGGSAMVGAAGEPVTTFGGAGGYAGSIAVAGSGGPGGVAATACDTGLKSDDCYDCLSKLCAAQWDACAADNETTVAQPGDPYCLSQGMSADPGQIELILNCVANERAKGLVKRDVVRACGATTGDSADPQYFLWAPEDMTPATKDLMNCMADAPSTAPADAGAWANDPNNFPEDGGALAPWPACTCAKISCTGPQ